MRTALDTWLKEVYLRPKRGRFEIDDHADGSYSTGRLEDNLDYLADVAAQHEVVEVSANGIPLIFQGSVWGAFFTLLDVMLARIH